MTAAVRDDTGQLATPLERIWAEVREQNLARFVAELDAQGYTVIPPEIASPNGLGERLLQACLDVAERRTGVRPDMATGETHKNFRGGPLLSQLPEGQDSPVGDLFQSVIFEDQVFEEALMNPVLLTMASYLCGYSVILSSMGFFVKGPNKSSFELHTDTPLPPPLPSHAVACNLTYVLTEFNRENGATAVVPGSHKWCRNPEAHEVDQDPNTNPAAVPVDAAPGSLIVWHGNLWHGAFNRTAPGLRVSMPVYMSRQYIRTQEGLIGEVPQDMLERNDPRFGWLLQQGIAYGYKSQDDGVERVFSAAKYIAAIREISGSQIDSSPTNLSLYG